MINDIRQAETGERREASTEEGSVALTTGSAASSLRSVRDKDERRGEPKYHLSCEHHFIFKGIQDGKTQWQPFSWVKRLLWIAVQGIFQLQEEHSAQYNKQ